MVGSGYHRLQVGFSSHILVEMLVNKDAASDEEISTYCLLVVDICLLKWKNEGKFPALPIGLPDLGHPD